MARGKYLLIIPERLSPPMAVESFEEASKIFSKLRDDSNEGASTWPDGLINDYGSNVARISYNGRVWPMDETSPPLFDPYAKEGA
jgi:hypothetical protein